MDTTPASSQENPSEDDLPVVQGMSYSDDLLTTGLEPLIYGGGQMMPVGENGELFYVAEGALLVETFDFIVGLASNLDTGEQADKAHAFVTFNGRINKQKSAGSTTVILDYPSLLSLIKAAKRLAVSVPIEYRNTD